MAFLKKLKSSATDLFGKIGDAFSKGSARLSGTETGKLSDRNAAGEYLPIGGAPVIGHRSIVLDGDLGHLLYVVYFLLGTGFLLPWNAFITAVDYFEYLYPNSHIDRVFSVSYLVPCLVGLALLVAYGKHFGARARVNCGLGLFFVCILVVPIMEALLMNGHLGNSWTFFVTVGAVAVAGVGDALVQGTLIGSAGQLPARYIQAIVSGTGFSGVLVSFLRIVTKYAFPRNSSGLRTSAYSYFTVSALFLVLCVVSYNAVHRLTVEMAHEIEYEQGVEAEGPTTEGSSCLDVENRGSNVAYEAANGGHGGGHNLPSPTAGDALKKQDCSTVNHLGFNQIFFQIKWLAGGIALTYVITLAIFPGFLTEDVKSDLLGDWYPVLLIACYNVFDLAGKSVPAESVPSEHVFTMVWSVARVMFIPLFSACVHGPHFFRTETPMFVLTALLGLTNGYFTTCFFLLAPKSVQCTKRDGETTGVVMVIALEVGLTLGSLLSWVWVV